MRSIWLPWPLLLAVVVALGSWPQRAHAEDKQAAALNWVRLTGAEACIDASTLARRVEERLSRAVFPAPAQARLIVEGRAEKTPEGFAASLRIFDQAGAALGSRDLTSNKADCSELSEAVVLVLAVMIDPDGALAATPAPPSTPPPAPKPKPKPQKPVANRSEEAPVRDLSLFARLEVGALPDPAFGAGAAALIHLSPFLTFRAEGAAFLEQEVTQVGDSGRGARFGLLYGGIEYCPLFLARPAYGVVACAGPSAGAMLTQSFGLDPRNRDKVDPVLNGNVRVRFDVALFGPVRAVLGAGVGTPFLRTQYEITKLDGTQQRLFVAEALQGNIDLGLAARF